MHAHKVPALPEVPLARPGPITDDMLGQLISEARAAEMAASYDVTGLYVRLILLPCLEELMARRAVMSRGPVRHRDVIALTRPENGDAA
jgi:hypothetical protein